jgi:hypothetical protein
MDSQQNGFAQYAPFAWSLVAATTIGLFVATLYLTKKR